MSAKIIWKSARPAEPKFLNPAKENSQINKTIKKLKPDFIDFSDRKIQEIVKKTARKYINVDPALFGFSVT